MYQICITRTFCASHQLVFPNGTLEPMHGHNWDLSVTVGAAELDEMACVMDFHELEKQVDALLAGWNNAHLNECEPFKTKRISPSAERVARAAADAIRLPGKVRLIRVDVTEAPGCVASWVPGGD
jgi:6-pyruvoyltetrahydropterin/6-carboxytetrahydropterin synthase